MMSGDMQREQGRRDWEEEAQRRYELEQLAEADRDQRVDVSFCCHCLVEAARLFRAVCHPEQLSTNYPLLSTMGYRVAVLCSCSAICLLWDLVKQLPRKKLAQNYRVHDHVCIISVFMLACDASLSMHGACAWRSFAA